MFGNCGWGDAFYIRDRVVTPPVETIIQISETVPDLPKIENLVVEDEDKDKNKETDKISLCITTMKRFDTFLGKSLEEYNKYLDEGLINEIVISDETGEDYDKIIAKWGNKFRVFKNETRLGVFKNKIRVVNEAANNIVILMDSDNFAPREYMVSILDYISNKKLSENFILSPALAKTNYKDGFDYRGFNNKIVTRANIKEYVAQPIFQILLNTGNYVFNKGLMANIKYDETVMKIISACDVIYFNLLAFQQHPDIELHIVPDLYYEHRVHPQSTYLTEINGATTSYRETQILPAYKSIV
jgi:hypothetical protein